MKVTKKLKARILDVFDKKVKNAVSKELITENWALLITAVFNNIILESKNTEDILKVIVTLTGCLDYDSHQMLLSLLSEDEVILDSMKRTIDYHTINEES